MASTSPYRTLSNPTAPVAGTDKTTKGPPVKCVDGWTSERRRAVTLGERILGNFEGKKPSGRFHLAI